MAALHAGASLVLPSIARGRISGIAERALSRQQADGTAQYECFCGECLDTAAMVSGSDGHGASHGRLFASIEAVAEHWDVEPPWMWDASIAFECGGLLWGRSRTMAALIKDTADKEARDKARADRQRRMAAANNVEEANAAGGETKDSMHFHIPPHLTQLNGAGASKAAVEMADGLAKAPPQSQRALPKPCDGQRCGLPPPPPGTPAASLPAAPAASAGSPLTASAAAAAQSPERLPPKQSPPPAAATATPAASEQQLPPAPAQQPPPATAKPLAFARLAEAPTYSRESGEHTSKLELDHGSAGSESRRSISPISSPPHRSSANDAGDDNADGDGADSAVAAGADSAEAAAAAAAAVQRPKYVRTGRPGRRSRTRSRSRSRSHHMRHSDGRRSDGCRSNPEHGGRSHEPVRFVSQRVGAAFDPSVHVSGFKPAVGYQGIIAELRRVLGRCGSIVDVRLAQWSDTGHPKKYAFVQFASPEEAVRAMQLSGVHAAGGDLVISNATDGLPRNRSIFNGGRGGGVWR